MSKNIFVLVVKVECFYPNVPIPRRTKQSFLKCVLIIACQWVEMFCCLQCLFNKPWNKLNKHYQTPLQSEVFKNQKVMSRTIAVKKNCVPHLRRCIKIHCGDFLVQQLFKTIILSSSNINLAHLHAIIRTHQKRPSWAHLALSRFTLFQNLISMFHRHNVKFDFDVPFESLMHIKTKHSAKCFRWNVHPTFNVLHFQW